MLILRIINLFYAKILNVAVHFHNIVGSSDYTERRRVNRLILDMRDQYFNGDPRRGWLCVGEVTTAGAGPAPGIIPLAPWYILTARVTHGSSLSYFLLFLYFLFYLCMYVYIYFFTGLSRCSLCSFFRHYPAAAVCGLRRMTMSVYGKLGHCTNLIRFIYYHHSFLLNRQKKIPTVIAKNEHSPT